MTVAELIARLQEQPQDMEVLLHNYGDGYWIGIETVGPVEVTGTDWIEKGPGRTVIQLSQLAE